MRPKERIEFFLNNVDLEQLFIEIWKIPYTKDIISKIELGRENIEEFWKDNSDLRFSQVLVNLEIIPNYPGFWYYWDEYEILEQQGYDPAEVNYWGIIFDKDMNPLSEMIFKPIKELDTKHIEAIIHVGSLMPYLLL
jgi:hypothetical protein